MATVALVSNKVVASTPNLIRSLDVTGGTTELAVTHGEDRAPDMIIAVDKTATANTAAIWTVRKTSATVVTVDCSVDAATSLADIQLIWFSHASGGLTNVA